MADEEFTTESNDEAQPNDEPEPPSDPGLTARLKALRPDDEPELGNAPLWAFDRSARSSDQTSDDAVEVAAALGGAAGVAAAVDLVAEAPEQPLIEELDGAVIQDLAAEDAAEDAVAEQPEQPPAQPAWVETGTEEPDEPAGEDASTDELWPESDPASADDAGESPVAALVSPGLDDDAAAAAATVPAAGHPAPVPVPREVDMGPEGPNRWWIWALVAVVAVAVLGAGVYAWWWTTSRPVTVPDVVGKTPAEATSVLYESSLTLGTVSEIPTDAAPPGTVVSQTPEATALLKPGDPVAFSVATLPDQATVPDVSGATIEVAQSTLARAQLSSTVVRSYSTTVPADTVIVQLPAAGARMAPGSVVVLVGSQGPAPATAVVPKVTGLNETEAVELIEANDLKAAVYRSINASVPAGEVMGQSPAARSAAAYGSTVQVLISQGAGTAPVTVPNVVGLSKSSATKKLESAKLKVASRTVPSASIAKGNVISQLPAAGSKSATGATVGLLVSAGNVPTVAVPSVLGTDTVGARKALQAATFTPVVLEVAVADYTPGLVFAQYPDAGVQYGRYFPVVALVAKAPQP